MLVYALAALGRAEDARAEAEEFRRGVFQGALSKGLQALADACALALEGRATDARVRFAEGFDALRRLDQLFELARWQILAAELLPDVPEAAGWAAEAREICEPLGARPYLDRLDAATAGSGVAPAPRAAAESVREPS
jgi:hypothetical protein